jgi:hypothetical protein
MNGGQERNGLRVLWFNALWFNAAHSLEHYGKLAVYIRTTESCLRTASRGKNARTGFLMDNEHEINGESRRSRSGVAGAALSV